jgi:hypothetical protein
MCVILNIQHTDKIPTRLVGVFMVYHHIKFQMPIPDGSLIIATKQNNSFLFSIFG